MFIIILIDDNYLLIIESECYKYGLSQVNCEEEIANIIKLNIHLA
jgi:hypothetical protein